MSIHAMSLVWKHFPAGGSDMLVMMALSDYGNDEGLSVHPSIRRLGQKTRLSESQVRRVLHGLIERGLVEVIGNDLGGNQPREYLLRLDVLESLPIMFEPDYKKAKLNEVRQAHTPVIHDTPSVDDTPGVDDRGGVSSTLGEGCHGRQGRGVTHDTRTINNHQLTTKKPSIASMAIPDWLSPDVWADWCEYRKEKSGKGWTLKAAELSLRKLEDFAKKGHDPRAIVDRSIESGWTTLYEPKGGRSFGKPDDDIFAGAR